MKNKASVKGYAIRRYNKCWTWKELNNHAIFIIHLK